MNSYQCDCVSCGVEAQVQSLNDDHDPLFCAFCGERLDEDVVYEHGWNPEDDNEQY